MANISTSTDEKVFELKSWLGLNEAPDGDTKLKYGEASEMRNWRVTRDGNLKRRPGTHNYMGLHDNFTYYVDEYPEPTPTASVSTRSAAQEKKPPVLFRTDDGETSVLVSEDLTLGNKGLLTYDSTTATTITGKTVTGYEDWFTTDGEGTFFKIAEVKKDGDVYNWYGWLVEQILNDASLHDVQYMWSGYVAGNKVFLAACDGILYEISGASRVTIGSISNQSNPAIFVHIFGFNGKAYILTGTDYYSWDGTTLSSVTGYRPLVAIAIPPTTAEVTGAGDLLENVNLLNGLRRIWISPDGENATFQLPEHPVASVDWVKNLATGSTLSGGYTVDTTNGLVTFSTTPDQATNSYEIAYTVSGANVTAFRAQVTSMKFSELYSGAQDSTIFLYGNGSNTAIYSGINYNGEPDATYFPDLYAVGIGDANTPITGMIRHGSALIAFKTDSAWSISMNLITLSDGTQTSAFYVTPVNRSRGLSAPGQMMLVNNDPITIFGNDVYKWINASYYSNKLTRDERQAQIISNRVHSSLKQISNPANVICWDDNDNNEYWLHDGQHTLVWNYVSDAWTTYTGFSYKRICNHNGALYIGDAWGVVKKISESYLTDNGVPIECYWKSGDMSFGKDYIKKNSASLFIGLNPETGSSVTVTVETDRKNTFQEKVVPSTKAKVAGKPFMVRTKIKAKKFVFYSLILKSDGIGKTATVVAADIRVRFTGYTR